jgi:hypothetical protein
MRIIYRLHAIERMFERQIDEEAVNKILTDGKIIEEYLDDKPYPSKLILGFVDNRPIHIVAAENIKEQQIIVITVYEPNRILWDDTFERRRK